MKHLKRIIVALILISFNAISQEIKNPYALVTYVVKKETSFLGMYECQLAFSNNQSIFVWKKQGDSSLKTGADGSMYSPDHSKHGVINYVDFKEKTLTSKDFIQYDKNSYLVKEELPEIQWNITNEKKQISNYTVTKATTSFRGREYIAWFSSQLPTQAGPWKLQGLPGLILEAYDIEQEIFFSVKKIEKTKEPFSVKDTFKGEVIDIITYYKKDIEAPFEMLKKVNARNGRKGGVSITGVNYNFLEKSFEYLAKEREEQISKK